MDVQGLEPEAAAAVYLEAIQSYRAQLEANPDDTEALAELGLALLYHRITMNQIDGIERPLDDEPLELLKRAYRLDPHRVGTLWGLGLYHRMALEHDKAVHYFEHLANTRPTDYHARSSLAQALRDAGRLDEAEQVTVALIDDVRELPGFENHYLNNVSVLADIRMRQGRTEEAERLLQEASSLGAPTTEGGHQQPMVACTHQALGQLYRSQGRSDEATALLVKAADIEPHRSDYQFQAAEQLFFEARFEDAERYVQRALAAADRPAYRALRERIHEELRIQREDPAAAGRTPHEADFDAALRAFERYELQLAKTRNQAALEGSPELRYRVMAGFLHLLDGAYEPATAAFEKVLASDADELGALTGMGHVELSGQDPAAARAQLEPLLVTLEQRLDLSLETPDGYDWTVYKMAALGVGWSHSNQAQHPEAIATYDKVLLHHPSDIFALLGKGNSLSALGKLDQAEAQLQRILDIDPDNQYAMAELALVHFNRGDMGTAQQTFEAALDVAPEGYTCPHEGLGLVMLRQGRTDDAKAAFEKAIEINPNIEYRKYNELARIHIAEGDLDEARRLLEKSVANFPHDPEAAEMLAGLEGGAP